MINICLLVKKTTRASIIVTQVVMISRVDLSMNNFMTSILIVCLIFFIKINDAKWIKKNNNIVLLILLLLIIQIGVAIYNWKTLPQEQMSENSLKWKARPWVMFQFFSYFSHFIIKSSFIIQFFLRKNK